jgi:hypothetical protein
MEEQNDEVMQGADELREHYDFDYSKAKPNRFAQRFSEESIAVVLDPDVAAVFTTSETVNQALRVLITALGNLAGTPDLLERVKDGTLSMDSTLSVDSTTSVASSQS